MITQIEFRKLNVEQQKQEIVNILSENPDILRNDFQPKYGYPCGSGYITKLFVLWSKAREAADIINMGSSIEKRLLNHREINSNNCWIWIGPSLPSGRGQINYNGKRKYVYRIAYELWVGSIPEGLQIRHHPILCNDERCFNPEHLLLGTAKDQGQDRILAGTAKGCKKGWKKPPKHNTLEERALWYLETAEKLDNGCIRPNKKSSTNGYVTFEFSGITYYLHRVICAITHNKSLQDSLWQSSHTCKNMWCCNPSHLESLSKTEHMNKQKETSISSKINQKIADEIRGIQEESNPFKTLRQWDQHIASIYDISESCISDIRLNKTWKNNTTSI